MIARHPITEKGKNLLTTRLVEMREQLPQVRDEVIEAQKKGDFSENFEYYAARKHLRELEFQIDELDKYIKSSDITKLPINPTMVCFGAKITLSREDLNNLNKNGNSESTETDKEVQPKLYQNINQDQPQENDISQAHDGTESYTNQALNNLNLTKEKKLITYVIVGDREAEPSMGTISNRSPLFQALVAKKVGMSVEFNDSLYTIMKIERVDEGELESLIKVN